MRDLITIDPMDNTIIDVGDLEHCVHHRVPSSPFTEHHLSHPPIAINLSRNQLLRLHNHKVARTNAQECGSILARKRTPALKRVVDAHQYT